VRIFGLEISRARGAAPLAPTARGGGAWRTVVSEPYTGAWQQNVETRGELALANFAVFACTTLIAADVGKVRLRLVAQDADGIWHEAESPAFSPVLRKPNRYQTIQKFLEQWLVSKLITGNTYVLKQRDERGVVRSLYVLDPARVVPLVTPDGAVYYELRRDDLAGLPPPPDGRETIVVPASEIIHDLMVALFHPLVGVSPIFACALAAAQGLAIQNNSAKFFSNGSHPGGVLTAPGAIADETAARLKEYWETNFTGVNAGRVAVLGDGLKYEPMTQTAEESQLIEQLNWSAETVCACYHVPPFMIYVGPPPPYGNPAPMFQQYYSQCLQALFAAIEASLDEGLELPRPYGTEFDIDDLIWLDHATKTEAAAGAIGAGAVSPNEARRKYYGLGPVAGGNSPMMQQQYYSLEALAVRDQEKPFSKATPATPPGRPALEEGAELEALAAAFHTKDWSAIL